MKVKIKREQGKTTVELDGQEHAGVTFNQHHGTVDVALGLEKWEALQLMVRAQNWEMEIEVPADREAAVQAFFS